MTGDGLRRRIAAWMPGREHPLRRGVRFLRRGWRAPLAVFWRRRLHPEHVVAVTGSTGKTTTVDMIGALLTARGPTRVGSDVNTWSAVVNSTLRTRRSHRFWVQEVSGHEPDAAAKAARLLRPTIVVVTAIGMDHIKAFRSREAIAAGKGDLVAALPADGVAVLNVDEPLIRAMASRTAARVVTFGESEDADVRLLSTRHGLPDRLTLSVSALGRFHTLRTRLIGPRWTAPVLGALAFAIALELDLDDCIRIIEALEPHHGRDSVHAIPGGPVVIHDAYKAPFLSMASSLETVRHARAIRRTIVIGTISDYLGSAGNKYRQLAREALASAERVVFVGRNIHLVAKVAAAHPDRMWTFAHARDAGDFLRRDAIAGELIYLKGSGVDHLERLLYDQVSPIACWREACGRIVTCDECRHLHTHGLTRAKGFDPAAPRGAISTGASSA